MMACIPLSSPHPFSQIWETRKLAPNLGEEGNDRLQRRNHTFIQQRQISHLGTVDGECDRRYIAIVKQLREAFILAANKPEN
ncbi:hypothetical protein ACN4EG_22955 [Alkalinema pantanalense CENA528]|uniref:hypothetical protein n=1 Tax=Alkalinema pantanalense TaxID=1620705 RepID=UPI003D6FDB13